MKIASWNINSVKARLPVVLKWLENQSPDILCMQEIKTIDDDFPRADFEALGYHITTHGQKSYNGVAIASKQPVEIVSKSLLPDDEQARYLEFDADGIRIINIYAPNGNPVDSEKYPYKLKWLKALSQRCDELIVAGKPFLITGDYNIIPTGKDCHDPVAWNDDALFKRETRALWQEMVNKGLYDAYRMIHPHEDDCYSFWDYQAGAWQRNNGIRIDHFLLSPTLADRLKTCDIDRDPRGWERPSDHTPIWIDL